MRQTPTPGNPMQELRKAALNYPEVEEGVSCDKAAFQAREKAFLFMGSDDYSYHALLKLGESLPEATKLARKQPHHYKVGGHDWVTATFGLDQSPPEGLLEKWIDESYRLLAPKRLVAKLPQHGLPAPGAFPAEKRKASKPEPVVKITSKKKTIKKKTASR